MARWDGYTLEQRFRAKVEKQTDGCWRWLGARGTRQGHGLIWNKESGRAVPAHRVAYELFVGPIPKGQHLHHRCERPWCVNPEHLEPIAPGTHQSLHKKMRPTCKAGHRWTPANTHIDKRGNRHCRACDAHRHRMARARRLGLTEPIGQGRRVS